MSKPEPAPMSEEFRRFDAAMGNLLKAPKSELDKRGARGKRMRGKKRKAA